MNEGNNQSFTSQKTMTQKINTENFCFYFQDQILQQDIYMYL
jgi:hypothetical protein